MRLLAAAGAALTLAACGYAAPLPGTGHVQGRVTVTPCAPVVHVGASPCPPAAGVRLTFGRFSTTTDGAGDYSIDLPPGDYDVVVSAGLSRPARHLHVAAGDRLTLDLDVDSGIR